MVPGPETRRGRNYRVLNAHQWGLTDCTGLFPDMGHDDHRQPCITQGGCLRVSASNACRIGRAAAFFTVRRRRSRFEIIRNPCVDPQRSMLWRKGHYCPRSVLRGAKDADHTVIPVAALAGCKVRGERANDFGGGVQRARGRMSSDVRARAKRASARHPDRHGAQLGKAGARN